MPTLLFLSASMTCIVTNYLMPANPTNYLMPANPANPTN